MEDLAERKAAQMQLIRQCMPKVATMVADFRKTYGAEHVVECQRRGLAGEPGWFFAREGVVAIGTAWTPEQNAVLAEETRSALSLTQAGVWMRKPGVVYGTDS